MASSTTNLDLTLPVGGENVSRQIINANNVKIDEAVGAVPSGTDLQSQVTALNNNISSLSDQISNYETVTFTPATGVTYISGLISKRAGITFTSLWIKITDSSKRSPNSVLGTFSASVGAYKRVAGTSQGNVIGWFAADGTSLKVENNYSLQDTGNYGYLINFVSI